ncbi:threonine aldolase family protein [Sporomusa acidovorans]|uniref:L-allo-threonine aldolase n=1 Tax=Sporomusa acidovorans (strain ATCC 49682 / DSM 3132 / Mol) TaxID=1123286 RepID=A0ABZ3IVY8_SPOA4|nr:GntG family PLP-dependent aldolase [Sporomusa acidovorans]OZC13976.1 L-allo-threonine aldolase [Sporomusa acidovorans DSM 3132]SDF21582.1 L-threonine aldolase [Sporomusa acidovorans]
MEIVDLRSDTVTKPTAAMRQAMFEAEVGDDGYGEDPTVQELEKLAAQMTGKEAGLFVTSGTQGNQLAVMVHAGKCSEVICEATAHMFGSETGGMAALTGAQPYPVIAPDGKLTPELIEPAIRKKKMNVPSTSLIAVENTHNSAGGVYYTPPELAAIKEVATQYALPVHMDGARIFNAAVAQNIPVADLARYADSMQMCLSKGLCAPVGSVLVGSADFIRQARRYRRLLGGGMRQVGIIAAAGIVALKTMVSRLSEDHAHARLLGEAVAATKLNTDLAKVQTNIVMADVSPLGMQAAQFVEILREHNIRASEYGKYKVRMVTHHDVSADQIQYAIKVLKKIAG